MNREAFDAGTVFLSGTVVKTLKFRPGALEMAGGKAVLQAWQSGPKT
jgi:hypothetical protein